MKTNKLIGGCILAMFLIGPTFAVSTVNFTPSGFGYLGAGGEVWAHVLTGSVGIYGPGESFATYCIELNEPLTYDVVFDAVVNPLGAVEGGYGGGNPDPVSDYTAWLYLEFVTGNLTPYEYDGTLNGGVDRNNSAKALQWVFWGLEDELNADFFDAGVNGATGVNQGLGGLQQEYFNLAYAAVSPIDEWKNNDHVQAVNIFGTDNNGDLVHMQDILVIVPAPGAIGLVLFGIGLFGYLKRKRTF